MSILLPLLPQAFVTLFGAAAAGISNPVNPLLEPHPIAEVLDAARTKILVALGLLPGTDIWQKVEKVRPHLKNLAAIVQVGVPLTGVGKVFKPQLRWDASERVFRETLAPLAKRAVRCDVTVDAHGTHGSLARITVHGAAEDQQVPVASEIAERLAPFVLRHEIAWE